MERTYRTVSRTGEFCIGENLKSGEQKWGVVYLRKHTEWLMKLGNCVLEKTDRTMSKYRELGI